MDIADGLDAAIWTLMRAGFVLYLLLIGAWVAFVCYAVYRKFADADDEMEGR
jgi:hypothetical protein